MAPLDAPFLHLFVQSTLHNNILLDIYRFALQNHQDIHKRELNVNVLNKNKETTLTSFIKLLNSNQGVRRIGHVKVPVILMRIIDGLIKNGRQNYSYSRIPNLFHTMGYSPLEAIIYTANQRRTWDKVNIRVFDEVCLPILNDMAKQCLDHFLTLQYREYRDIENYLIEYVRKNFYREAPNMEVARMANDEEPETEFSKVQIKVVKSALRMLAERYHLGFASAHCHHYLSPIESSNREGNVTAIVPIPSIKPFDLGAAQVWNIVIDYCYPEQRLLPYLYDAYHMGLHFELPISLKNFYANPLQLDLLNSCLSSYQLVPLAFNVFKSVVESNPVFPAKPTSASPITDAETAALMKLVFNSYVIVRVTDKADNSDKAFYEYRYIAKGMDGYKGYGMKIHKIIAQPSFQPNTTVVQYLDLSTLPEPVFLYLHQNKCHETTENPPFKLRLKFKKEGLADHITPPPDVDVKFGHFMEFKIFEDLAKEFSKSAADNPETAVTTTNPATAAATATPATAAATVASAANSHVAAVSNSTVTPAAITANAIVENTQIAMLRTSTSLVAFYNMVTHRTKLAQLPTIDEDATLATATKKAQ